MKTTRRFTAIISMHSRLSLAKGSDHGSVTPCTSSVKTSPTKDGEAPVVSPNLSYPHPTQIRRHAGLVSENPENEGMLWPQERVNAACNAAMIELSD